jgi:hypothetical protein
LRGPAVEKTANDVARNRRAITGEMGHVRLRTRLGDPVGEWNCELFGAASKLVAA